ncbi:hypothetical protein RRG08_004995, partial [Elysia crispata]
LSFSQSLKRCEKRRNLLECTIFLFQDCPQDIEACKTAYDVQKETVGVSCT